MFKNRKPRQFNYSPLFYDPKKEEREERQRLGDIDADDTAEEKYVPGSIIRKGRMKRMTISETEANIKSRANTIRLIVFIALLGIVAYMLITTGMIEVLVVSFRNS